MPKWFELFVWRLGRMKIERLEIVKNIVDAYYYDCKKREDFFITEDMRYK